ncbi:MAG TPA: hypothetical protein VFQ76_05475, partial [Longimicrobiaceae bacterium]|nr:hypothetical protein [Longimicrobiaceae bacterium]
MRRLLACAAAGALLFGAAEGALAQEMEMGRRASRFDLGVYAGGSVTTDWFSSRSLTLNGTANPVENDDEEGFAPGYGPAFGALANLWLTPALGVRLHGAYVPMQLPTRDGAFDVPEERASYEMNTWFYDVGLTVRPFVTSGASRLLSSVYLFAGGGGVTVDLSGEDREQCQRPYLLSLGACLSRRPSRATVGQGVVGAGIDLLPVVANHTLFGEVAVHVYDSPVHVGDEWVGPVTAPAGSTVRVADDAVAFTPRLVIGVKLKNGDLIPMSSPPPPPPPLPPAAPPPPPAPPRTDMSVSDLLICVVDEGTLRLVRADYDTRTGDTIYQGRPFTEAFPATAPAYAANAQWYADNDAIPLGGRTYVKYGYPRVLGAWE